MIKQASDIVEVIGEYVKLAKSGRIYKGLCPFHDDHNPSMNVDPQRQTFKCWVCGKYGDVITFIQERERVEFREALELLANRANITLRPGRKTEGPGRSDMLELMKWAEVQYHQHLLKAESAEAARDYVKSRGLSAETIEKYGLGFAPNAWEWLALRGPKQGWSAGLLEKVGLCGRRERDNSLYDRFRERIMFPIRDVRGRTVGFGGRILPASSSSADAPKYYNSTDTPLFTKSELLYGLDRAREAGEKAGYLAVVEGYTDVLMAHQMGVMPVVATLGTALNSRHIRQLRRLVPRVVLVFDGDEAGRRAINNVLPLFVMEDVDLAVATLPDGLDPCDFLLRDGAEAFTAVLGSSADAFEFKLVAAFSGRNDTVHGRQQAVDEVLEVLALVPELASQKARMKLELMVTRLAARAAIRDETVWDRLQELRREKRRVARPESSKGDAADSEADQEQPRAMPADPAERELLEILLAEPRLLPRALEHLDAEAIRHPGLRRLWEEMVALHEAGEVPSADLLRARLTDRPRLAEVVLRLQAAGLANAQRSAWLDDLLQVFQQRRVTTQVTVLQSQLQTVPRDGPPPLELLERLREQKSGRTGVYGQRKHTGIE